MAKTSTTVIGHVDRAVDFFNKPDLYMAIATQLPWPSVTTEGLTEETTDFSSSVKGVPLLDVTARNIGRIIEAEDSHTILPAEGETEEDTITIPVLEDGNRTMLEDAMRARLTSKPFYVLNGTTYEYTATFDVMMDNEGQTFSVTRRQADGNVLIGSGYALGTHTDTIVSGLSIKVEANPDSPDLLKRAVYTFTIDAAFGFSKIDEVKFVRKVKTDGSEDEDANVISYRNEKWKFFTTAEEAYAEETRAVYVKATFDYDTFPLIDFRQVGVFSGLQRGPSIALSKNKLLPHEIENCGVLHLIDCRSAIYRSNDQREVFAFIIEH